MSDAKDYITKREIPQLFECLMTGLMYHRPSDHVSYLQDCLEKIKTQGVQGVRWDLFLEAKRAKTPLPPISAQIPGSRENSLPPLSRDASQQSLNESKTKVKLPPIGAANENQKSETEKPGKPAPGFSLPANIPIINIMGGPGSGKKDICTNVCERYGFTLVSVGDLLRKKVFAGKDQKTKWKVAEDLMSGGELAPEEVTLSAVIKALNDCKNAKGIVLEGYPRTMEQVKDFDEHIGSMEHIYLIDCEQDHLQERLLRRFHQYGKTEDQPGNIAKRINSYKNNTLPVCRHYDDLHKLVVLPVDSDVSDKDICTEVFRHFDQFYPPVSDKIIAKPPTPKAPSSDKQDSRSVSPETLASAPVTFIKKLENLPEDSERKPDIPKCPIMLLLGGPGSGRSSQASKIAARYDGFVHISIADIAREKNLSKGGDDAWKALTDLAYRGDLDDAVDIDLVRQVVVEKGASANCILLEGFPIEEKQLRLMYEQIGSPDLTILLDCEEYYMTSRLLCRGKESGRIDDNLSAISKRIQFFKQHTLPVIRHFDEAGKLCIVLGDRDADEIFYDIASLIDYCFFNQLPQHVQNDQDAAAEKIQAAFKGYLTRKEFSKRPEEGEDKEMTNKNATDEASVDEFSAATKIQAGYRGYQTRQSLKKDNPQHTGSDADTQQSADAAEDVEAAAAKIQAGYRGYQTRKTLNDTSSHNN